MFSSVGSQIVISTHLRKSAHPVLSAQETSLGWNLKNHEAGEEQTVLDLSRGDPRYCCSEQGVFALLNSWCTEITTSNPGHYSRMEQEGKD